MESPEGGSASDSSAEYDELNEGFVEDSTWPSYGSRIVPEPFTRAGGAKRRFGPGMHGPIGARDVKSRRRDEPGPSRKQGGPWQDYPPPSSGGHVPVGKKEELIDSALVDTLRQSKSQSVALCTNSA